MNRFFLASMLIGSTMIVTGCTEKATVTKETTVKTPGGTTTVTTKQDVEKTGDHKDGATKTETP